ncbi:Methionyl-tRNA formyltransferase [Candidatus Izimaplasma bacterium HR1]|jgi:methionyl-tRNA formyltransferase|uniref:methionyl-tRNA formyltransferase n=1 Tax=Candidatus Izimoplasma sp. HR1 TaxID=1541959 RepID=UPI0004F67E42|nr:Methionyl-tRNA formyltransferase [Candidatus Izimaplasma bacterium HR1]
MKIVFMGTPDFSVRVLKDLHEKYPVSLVVTQPDKQVGRKKIVTFSPVKIAAIELGIEVFQPVKIRNDYERILQEKPDIIITAAYGQIIPKIVLDNPQYGAINVHGSLLPLLRGGAPIQRSIKRLHNTTGITIMYMAMKMDSGDIITQRSIPILKDDTSGTLFEKLSYLGSDLLLETLPTIFEGTNKRIPQDEYLVSYAYNLKREEEVINWDQEAQLIDAHLRAFTPTPSCYTTIDDKQIKIYNTLFSLDLKEADESKANGSIVIIEKEKIGVKVRNGYIYIYEVQLSGKKRQDIKTFMNGAGRNIIIIDKVFK